MLTEGEIGLPSPKSQLEIVGVGADEFKKLTRVLTQTLSGATKFEVTFPAKIGVETVVLSAHPFELTTTSFIG